MYINMYIIMYIHAYIPGMKITAGHRPKPVQLTRLAVHLFYDRSSWLDTRNMRAI